MNQKEEQKQKIVIKLIQEPALDKKGKQIKDSNGEVQFQRDDMTGLMILLNRFDTKKHPGTMKLLKALLNIKDKVQQCWIKDRKELNLTLEEASWLKQYLNEILDKEAKEDSLRFFEIKTLVGISEQLE